MRDHASKVSDDRWTWKRWHGESAKVGVDTGSSRTRRGKACRLDLHARALRDNMPPKLRFLAKNYRCERCRGARALIVRRKFSNLCRYVSSRGPLSLSLPLSIADVRTLVSIRMYARIVVFNSLIATVYHETTKLYADHFSATEMWNFWRASEIFSSGKV